MPNIERVTGKIFAENASPVGNNPEIGKFGNAKQGIFIGEANISEIQNSDAWSQGWTSAVVSAMNYPPLPEMNGVLKNLSQQICYLLQKGVPEWDNGTVYYTNNYVNYNGALYYSTIDNNTTEPTTAEGGNNWKSGTVELPIATTSSIGAVQPDGVSIDITPSGVISLIKAPIDTQIIDTAHPIGDPIFTFNNTLNDNEIWLEGATVSRETYAQLFEVYGTTYGEGDGETTFTLPDCRNRVFWGTDESTGFGYIEPGLPNIIGEFGGDDRSIQYTSGAFFVARGSHNTGSTGSEESRAFAFDASRSNLIYGNSTTVQPPSIKIRVKTRYQ